MSDGHLPVRKLNVLCIAAAPGTFVVGMVRRVLELDFDLSDGISCDDTTTTGAALRIHLMRERLEIARSSAFLSLALLIVFKDFKRYFSDFTGTAESSEGNPLPQSEEDTS